MKPQRVQLHPATDLWARGARTGTAFDLRSDGAVAVHVDRLGKPRWFAARDVMPSEKEPLTDAQRVEYWRNQH